jgi:hypothetical protein
MTNSLSYILTVIPAKAGIQLLFDGRVKPKLDPRLGGGDGSINLHIRKQR